MIRRIKEQSVILYSVLRWVVLSVITGLVVGVAIALFLKLLDASIGFAGRYPLYYLFLPIVLFTNAFLARNVFPKATAYKTDKVIECLHTAQEISPMSAVKAFFLSMLTIAAGGSAGKEAPAADVGAGIGMFLGKLLRLNAQEKRKLAICGISAGFASVFGTPIAGALFGVEVLYVGTILYDILLPSFIAGIISYNVTSKLGIHYFHRNFTQGFDFSAVFFYQMILAGIFFGLCSFFFVELLRFSKKNSEKLQIGKPLQGCIGGVVLIVIALLFSPVYLGLGLKTTEAALSGAPLPWYSFIIKSFATSATLNFGGSGGIVTPIFFIGSSVGNLFAQIFHLDIALFSALGLVGLLAGATNTPIAASIMAIELFGPGIAPYAALVCVISFLMTGHRSVFPSQILAFKKSPLLQVELGKRIDTAKPHL